MKIGVIKPLQSLKIIRNFSSATLISHSIVHILGYPTPATSFCSGTPCNDVATREVEIAVEEIHHHEVHKLMTVHPFLVFSHRVPVLMIESRKLVPIVHVAFLDVIPVLNQVKVFQTVVISIDIILLCSLADVEHRIRP